MLTVHTVKGKNIRYFCKRVMVLGISMSRCLRKNYILTDFKNTAPIIPHFLGNVMKNLSVDYLCRGHTWLESDFNLILKCRGKFSDVTLVLPISKDFTNHWFRFSS